MQIRHTHPKGFRTGEWAKIIGIVPKHDVTCFEVEFPDGQKDYWPVSELDLYDVKSEGELREKLIPLESAQSSMRAVVARALAEALVNGIDNAAEEGRPLTQLQQTDIATMVIMSYDNALEGGKALEVEVDLLEASRRGK